MNIMQLNESQQSAVESVDGPVMILAGAGSGKTRTLTARMAYLLREKRIHPTKILALTFSRKAANEMRERMISLHGVDNSFHISTFHSFCAKVLRQNGDFLGLSRNFTIYDTSESKAVVKDILLGYKINLKTTTPFDVLSYISSLKNKGHYPGRKDFSHDMDKEFFPFYQDYEVFLAKANAVDFDGLITGVIQLFEKYPDVLRRYQENIEYVLVDEYQDTNRAQFQLITMLCEKKRNLCVVGDEDQSIYSWRGADINNIFDFEDSFPEARLIKLEQNYRSSKNIIEAAGFVIAHNTQRKDKVLWTDNTPGEPISIVKCRDDRDEAAFVAEKILDLLKRGVRYQDIAVFYRAHMQSRLIEDSLRYQKIPYTIVGGLKFYERKEIKDMMAYLKLVVNHNDSLALGRIINTPPRGIGTTSLKKIEAEAQRAGHTLWDFFMYWKDHQNDFPLSARTKNGLVEFIDLIKLAGEWEENKQSPSEIYNLILKKSGYKTFLDSNKNYETMAKKENLGEFQTAIAQFEMQSENPSLRGFLETIVLDDEDPENNQKKGQISLMTIHGAKGLEFPYTFILAAEENIFPSYLGIQDGHNGVEEERRLFYVAMTRAMKKLYISYVKGRMLFGQIRFNDPSRFVGEIPKKFCIYEKYPDHVSDLEDSQDPQKESSSHFKKGANVIHAQYGKGRVLQCKGKGESKKIVIDFHGTKKTFMLKYTPLRLE